MIDYPWVVMPNEIQILASIHLKRELTPKEEAYAEDVLCDMLEKTLQKFGRYLPRLVEEVADEE